MFDQIVFIADEYARCLFNWLEGAEYKTYQKLYSSILLPEDFTLYEAREFHGLIDEFGKQYLGKKSVKKNFLSVQDIYE